MTPERIARLWAAVCGGDATRATAWTAPTGERVALSAPVRLPVAAVGCPADGRWHVETAHGLTEAEALAALWELVVLHARVRRDEINAALAAEGMRV